MRSLLKSRKFWIAIASIVASGIMLATKQISAAQFQASMVITLAALKIGIAIDPGPTALPPAGGAA